MQATAEQKGMANGHTSRKEITRTLRNAKLVGNVARDLVRSLRALEDSLDFDFFGRVVWVSSEPPKEVAGAVEDLLRLARADYPTQEIEVSVRVKVPASGTEDREEAHDQQAAAGSADAER